MARERTVAEGTQYFSPTDPVVLQNHKVNAEVENAAAVLKNTPYLRVGAEFSGRVIPQHGHSDFGRRLGRAEGRKV